MQKAIIALTAICFVLSSCTKDKTDYKGDLGTDVPNQQVFKEAYGINIDAYRISIEALDGTFYTGYNEVRLTVTDTRTKAPVQTSAATFLPILTTIGEKSTSGPHRYEMDYESEQNHFVGYSVFTQETRADSAWDLYLTVTINGQTHNLKQPVNIAPQANRNLNITSFHGDDGEQYIIALIAPRKPEAGENDLVAGIYRFNASSDPSAGDFPDPSQFSFNKANGYTLLLDPRMPEPSMGNHSSPNNKDLTQREDGLYQGVVNYTMTGNWTLNFILLNEQADAVKGTPVPSASTPGVEGKKSELYIDVLL